MAPIAYDLVVIGTGSAAAAVASTCRQAGWRVAVVDARPFGGTCAQRGCDPKKVLVGAAEAMHWVERLGGKGIAPGGVAIAWPELMAFKRTFTDPVPASRERGFAKQGIDGYHGPARFVGPTAVEVNGDRLDARHVVIATGARPAPLAFPGAEHLSTSDDFLELEQLPARLVFVGGGYISMEFAHVAVRAGAAVTVLHRGPRPLEGFEPALAALAAEAARDAGIDLRLDTEVTAVERHGSALLVRAADGGGTPSVEADLVVHGAGRVAAIDDLDLERGSVARGRRGIRVNEYLQSTSNPAVYAAGDAADTAGRPLTPVAAIEGRTVAANLLEGNRSTPDYAGIPTVAFTLPPLAAVGLREDEARAAGHDVTVIERDMSGWYSVRRVGASRAASRVVVAETSGRILGAHVFGPGADEIINFFAIAIRHDLTVAQLRDVNFAYPTHASDLRYMIQ